MAKNTDKFTAVFAAAALMTAMLPAFPAAAADNGLVFSSDFESEKGIKLESGAELAEGKNGKGLHLDGVDDYAVLPENIISDEMTISAWVKQDKKNVWGRLFDLGEDSSNNFFFAPCSGGASRVEAKSPQEVSTLDAAEFEAARVWAYYTVTADKDGFRLYRDGKLMAEKKGGIKLSNIKDSLNYIGKSHYEGDAYFAGTVDDFKVYNRVLSDEEILADMAEHISVSDADEIMNTYSADIEEGQILFGDSVGLDGFECGDLKLVWNSSDESVINTSTGTITPGKENKKVKLTLKAAWEGTEEEPAAVREYNVTVPSGETAPFTVEVNAADRSKQISDHMWGMFFEDINSAADGGLYAELIQNCSFEYPEHLYSWTAADGVEVKTEGGLNENNPTYIEITDAETENDGYMGMSVKKDAVYNLSLYAKGSGKISVQLLDDNGNKMSDLAWSEGYSDWTKLEGTLTSDKDAENAGLKIAVEGTSAIDYVSLMPQDTYKGHGLRKDLCEAIEEVHPKFLRFPGGCAVEGRTMELAYNWKDTVGDRAERKQMENIWNSGEPDPYIMSYGLGFYEYFQLCEDMGMEPVPILNCGIACQVRSGDSKEETYLVPLNKLQPYIDDAIDLVAFANSTDMNNKWAKLRADMGHPEPFNLKYLGIGNEQWGNDYFARYEAFAKELRKAYPDMELNLVTTSGTASSGDMNDLAWDWANSHNEYADVMDEHYYEAPDWFRTHAYRYDNYDRDTTKVFLGEYASKGNTWYNALSEAAFMTGLERNADVVRMASYAPMFAKYGNTQWSAADMIWFNNSDMVKTPNYYVQKLFGNNTGDYSLETAAKLDGAEDNGLTGGIAIGTWNTQAEYKDLKLTFEDGTEQVIDFKAMAGEDGMIAGAPGEWRVNDDGSVTQSAAATGCINYIPGEFNDYTLTVKARKLSGGEGFQIGVGGKDSSNYYRINMGGWSNTATRLQKITDGASELVSNLAEGNLNTNVSVKENQWQEIKVIVKGSSVEAYLDGELACRYTKPQSYGPVYASSVYDNETGDVVLKLVNTADADLKVNVRLDNAGLVEPNAAVTVMSAEAGAVNTPENKDNVVPRERSISNASNEFVYEADARSLSVIRIKTSRLKLNAPGSAEFYDTNGSKHDIRLSYDENGVLTGVEVD
ncbi:MAG: alpha-L-arabinofuranosidase C-terminal domain-containing protein [bacterium]|nr:alpha-L-arabinofuranosidase C-terminal domain-containing protein [bacterium]